MKKIFITLVMGAAMLSACQNELYNNPVEDFSSEQGAYIDASGPIQIFVEEGREYNVKDIKVGLTVKEDQANSVSLIAGDEAQLQAYNEANGTQYLMLPAEMYEVPQKMEFKATSTKQMIPIKLKDIKFSMEGDYALPIKIVGGGVNVIPGEDEGIVILEKRIRTKVLKMAGSEAGSDQMFPQDFKVNQWTMEVMINRSDYSRNNQAIAGTKLVANAGPMDEIYTRFGDVTIAPNQLQIKTGASQIDIPKNKFAAKADEWYMLGFVYDGKNTIVYVNGEVVAEQQIREGAYGLVGFWLSGVNKYVREVRFWDVARTQQQIKSYVWKMVNPTEKGLLLYYPCNGQKRNHETGEITEDASKIWNWATYYGEGKDNKLELLEKLDLPTKGSIFDDNGGDMFVFPLEE